MIIRSIRRPLGLNQPSMQGERVVVIAIHRGDPDHEEILTDDAAVGKLEPDDRLECVQIYRDDTASSARHGVTCDVDAWGLGPDDGRWDEAVETTIVMTKRTWLE